MENITQIISKYKQQIQEVEQLNLCHPSNLKKGIDLSKEALIELRFYIQSKDCFPSQADEVKFFKFHKPFVYGRLKYFSKLLRFQMEFPPVEVNKQIEHIQAALDKLEIHRKRNLEFFNYCRRELDSLDHVYFVRGAEEYEFFTDTSHYFSDPEFCTSHDNLKAQVVAYDLLVATYGIKLDTLNKKLNDVVVEQVSPAILNGLSWTASKTDLVELLYALQASGAIRNGTAELSKMAEVCAVLFDIDLKNFYKTYAEIRNRDKDPTKFLDQLKESLLKRINTDNRR